MGPQLVWHHWTPPNDVIEHEDSRNPFNNEIVCACWPKIDCWNRQIYHYPMDGRPITTQLKKVMAAISVGSHIHG